MLTRIRSNQALESGRVTQRTDRLPGPDEGVLGGILGFVLVAQEHARQAIGPVELAVRKAQESITGITGARGAQFSLPSFERGCDSA